MISNNFFVKFVCDIAKRPLNFSKKPAYQVLAVDVCETEHSDTSSSGSPQIGHVLVEECTRFLLADDNLRFQWVDSSEVIYSIPQTFQNKHAKQI